MRRITVVTRLKKKNFFTKMLKTLLSQYELQKASPDDPQVRCPSSELPEHPLYTYATR